MPSLPRVHWPWTNWSLTRKLPLLTATIVVLVLAMSLTLTYSALVRNRSEAMHERLTRLARQLASNAEQTNRQRRALLLQVTADPSVHELLRKGTLSSAADSAAAAATLSKLVVPADSGLPAELWTIAGRRLAQIGEDIRNDPKGSLPPELRSATGQHVSELPSGAGSADSIQFGALYPSDGRVYYWSIAPIAERGRRIGYIAQQRRIANGPQVSRVIRELTGEEVSVSVRNVTDGFWSTLGGEAMSAPTRRDTSDGGFIAERPGKGQVLATEVRISGTPWIIVLELSKQAILDQPRATVRKLALFSLLLTAAGVFAAYALSRRITRPLVALTTAAEAVAQGDLQRRVAHGGHEGDEVSRLGASFNHMAERVEASQEALAGKVDEALRVSQALEQANAQLQQASRDAEEARDAAEQANRAKSDFLAVMSHELRTPLNAIGGYAEILELGIHGPVNDPQRDALRRISRSQQALLSLINDVLNFAKLEAGGVQYAIRDVKVSDALATLEVLIAPQLSVRRLSYEVAGCDPSVAVRADQDKLQQILLNLLSNAIKYTPEGGRISVDCELVRNAVRIHVRDSGIGVAEERLEAIFEPFVQVGRALNRPHDGVGLGLAISRDLAEAMGGKLTVVSMPGEGSTFTLEIPTGER